MDLTSWTDDKPAASFRLPGSSRTHSYLTQELTGGHVLVALACGTSPNFRAIVPTDEPATCPRCTKAA